MTDIGHNSANENLRLFLERIDRLEEEKKGIADDIRDVFSEAKAVGYDVTMMREMRKLRKMDNADRAEREAIRDTYKSSLGLD
jgi:uncharacterized protein (UPF0335 family)